MACSACLVSLAWQLAILGVERGERVAPLINRPLLPKKDFIFASVALNQRDLILAFDPIVHVTKQTTTSLKISVA